MKKKGDMTSAEYRHYLKTGKEPDNRAPVCAPNRKPVRPSNEAGAMGDEKNSSRFSCIDVQIHVTRRRRTDREATRIKAVIDGIVHGGIVKDDGEDEIKTIRVTKEKGSPEETVITVTPADPDVGSMGVIYR